jgi:hypothetical protein
LRKQLISNNDNNLIDSLDLSIRSRIETEEWKLVIIESAVMFESWIQPLIKGHYIKSLGSKTKAATKLSFKDIEGRSHPMPMGDILKSLIKDAFSFDFENTDAYKNVTANTISPRNKIVHGDGFAATKKTAIAAYLSAHAAIEAIRPHVSM